MIRFYTSVLCKGSKILYRGYNNGQRIQNKIDFKPTLYTKSTKKKTEYRSMYGEYLEPHTFESIIDAKDFVKEYSDVSNYKVYGNSKWEYQFIAQNFPENTEYDFSQLKIISCDIETTVDSGFPDPRECLETITLVTFQNLQTREIVTFSCLPGVDVKQFNGTVHQYKTEIDMLHDVVNYFIQQDIDILTGWNIEGFDIPYLVGRMNMLLGEDRTSKISPWGNVVKREFTSKFGDELTYDIKGISCIDYLQLYKKFTYVTRENYTLGHIAECEIGHTKVDNPYDTFKDHYTLDPNSFVSYNQRDAELICMLDDKLGLLHLVVSLAQTTKVNFNDVFSPVKTWETYINAVLHWENTFAPLKSVSKSDDSIEGGYVKEPIPGMYKWVCSYDLNSLYPHIMMACNMSPETITNETVITSVAQLLKDTAHITEQIDTSLFSVAANGSVYDRNKVGIMPRLMRKLYDERKVQKKKMLQYKNEKQNFSPDSSEYKELDKKISLAHVTQLNIKILLNSCYGACANQYFQFFDNRIAEGITMCGQLIIQRAGNDINSYLNKILKTDNSDYVTASDTDSLYISLEKLCNKMVGGDNTQKCLEFLSKASNDIIAKKLNEFCDNLSSEMGWNKGLIEFKLENISDVSFWTGKKRYAMNVLESEGVRYKEPETKIVGLEIVRSSTPAVVREMLRNTVDLILNKDEQSVQEYFSEIKQKFNSYSVEEISFPRSANNLLQYTDKDSIYKKGTPIAVRGALLYNHYIKENKLDKKYQLIREGDKVKFVYLKVPNKIREDVIAYVGKLPPELNIHRSVNYDLMFEKTYIDPLKNIMTAIGWQYEKQSTIEDFFG